MALHRKKEEALLNWINSLHLDSPIDHIFLLQDGVILVKLIHKLKKQEIGVDAVLELPLQGRLDFISAFLQKDCRYKADRGTIVSWDNIVLGKNLDVELSKVVVLLLYHSLMNGLLGLDRLGYDIELELADVLRFVLNNEDSLYLSDNLEKILKKQSIFDFSSASSSSFSDEESPVFSRRRRPEVQFLELKTVASSSVGSPIQDVLNTPQFRLRKLQKQLVQEREMRDELERELASRSQVITEREMQVSQLQHRVQRMMRDSEEQEQQPKEIEQLQRKNEGLLTRLHDVLKQCQELKTNKTQMERKIDDLTEENGILSVQMREIFSRLSSAEAAVQKLSAEQESSQVEWESKRGLLESELGQALSQKEYLNEQIQILQGKISILEDELSKAKAETLGGGEVMGPIMEWERLNQEIADLNHKLSQLQEIIIQLQKEKKEIEMMYEVEKTKFEAEKARLEELVSELNKMLTVQRGEREALEQALREQRVSLEAQIEALTADIASLTEAVQQRELAVTNFSQKVDVERKRVEKLTEEMEKQERFAQKTIQELHERVDHLGSVLNSKEEEARSNAEEWARERHEISRQQEVLMEARETISRERDAIATEYQHFQQEKEEVACKLNQQIVLLEEQQSVERSLLSELRKEKQELEQKVSSIEAIVDNLRTRCHGLELDSEAQRASHQEEVESLKRKLHEAESILGVYEGKLADHQKIVEEHIALRDELSAAAECAKGLRDELEVERSKHKETLAAKLQSKSQMMEEMRELEEKTQNMSVEMQHLGQQLSKVQQEKMRVDASMAKLIEEGRDVERGLTAARDQAFLTIKEREAETSKLRSEAEALSSKVILAEEAKAIELAKKDDEMQVLSKEMKQIQMELGTVKKAKDDMELDLQSSIEKRQEQLLVLRFQMNELEESANQKETEIEVLQTKLSNKDEELKAFCLHEKVEREELQRQLKQEEDRCLMYKQEIVVKDKEVNFLKMAMVAKEEEINSLMQSIHSGEEKASAFQDLQEKRHEEQKQAISTLEIRLSDAHRLLEEKASSIEMQTSQVMQLQRDLSTEQERVVSLEQSMKVSDDALIHCKLEKEALKNEVTSLQELAEKLKGELEELKREHENLRLQVAETETLHNKSEERIAQLQARLGTASALASEKDSQLESLHAELKERDSLRIQAAEMEARHKELEESIAQLQARLGTASALASEKDSQLESLHAELKERDSLRIQAAEMEARHKELEESIAQLQARLGTASALASEKDSQLESLHAELKERDSLRIQAAEMEARHKELQESIAPLQTRLGTASALASEKDSQLELLHAELKERDSLRIQAAEMEARHKELEESIAQLQARLGTASALASEKDSQLESLHAELKERDSLRIQAAEMEARHKELEESIAQLQARFGTASALASEKDSQLESLHAELKERDGLRIQAAEMEARHKELEESIAQLQARLGTASVLASEKDSQLESLHAELKERDSLRIQAAEMEARHKELQESIAPLQARLGTASALASEKDSQLELLHAELKERDSLRIQAAEMEARHKELEESIAQLQARLGTASALASEKDSQLESLHAELKERDSLRIQAAEMEARHKELEESIAQLQAQLGTASVLASEKDSQLESLHAELKERDGLRIQAAEMEARHKELQESIAPLQARLGTASALASEKDSQLELLHAELKERDSLRIQAAEMEARHKELEESIAQLQARFRTASALASEKDSQLESLHAELKERDSLRIQAAEMEARHKELEESIAQLQARLGTASALASEKDSQLESLHAELKERDGLRIQAAEMEARHKELEESIAQLQARLGTASALASEKDSQLESLHAELKERDGLRIQAAEMEALHKELEESIAQLQAQLGTASVLASEKDSQLESLYAELKERDSLRIQAAEMEARHKELEESIAQLQARLGTASALASGKQSELDLLHKEVREREKLRIRAVEVEEAQHKELEERVTEASTLASERKSQLDSLHNEMNEKDHVIKTQHMELESTVTQLKEQLHTATSLAAVQKRVNEKLNEDIRRLDVVRQESMERDALRIRAIEAEDLKRKEMEETIVKLKSEILTHTTKLEHLNKWHQQQLSVLRNENQTLLSMKESMVKEQEVSQRVKVSLESKLKLAGQELSVLLPLQECKAENERLIGDLQEQLQAKTEAMKHCKAQVQMAKTHYNGKKQQLLEVQEKAQTLENTLESRDQEVKVLRSEMKLLQIELDQAKLSEKDLALKVNSLQAQVDYADRQLREYAKHGIDTTLNTCKPPSQEERSEKLADLSKDSLDFCLDDSLSATRKPLAHEESSTPLVRSSERLRAKRRALGDDSIDTIFFTPMASNCPRSKLENSIMSLGELAIDSSKKSYSARRRTTQKTPGKAEVDGESSLFSSLHSAQSVPNIASQRNRPISMEFFDEPVGGSSDHLLSLPGYRRSTTHSHVPPRNINTYGVGAENEPDVTDDWKRIVELQARNKACLPHLKSSYPLESRPSLGMPLFNITDEDLRTGDPMETIRRASMLPDQIGEGVASRRSTMLPGQIGAGLASRRASVLPKPASVVGQNAGGSVFSLKRQGDNLLESDTPEAKKMPSCFPRPIQSKSPNTPAERRQSVMFSVDNTPHKNAKSSILQRGINKMRSSTRKSPGSVSKIAGSVSKIAGSVSKIPRSRKSPQSDAAKPQRRSPRINCRKSPKITASAKKSVDSTGRWQHYHADNGLPATNEDMIAGRVLVCPTASHPDKHQSN
ncbi:nuclear mitotic apparatus protein 1 isoform X2 [Paramormyrops kingsleyae]|uniref:nuclear mitotic apparatus protein 1 isoform X2 n=1 Tax=Paramormyrops kingsleyae TaxID=1676925 RepID=UPI003B97671C